ncbi:hypothetical protein C8T65DRAFT_737028 [Cerioporus squamosus]|nr:hypothetical protein C8T65DRAFT_737028 [Cerioporus squamosus]
MSSPITISPRSQAQTASAARSLDSATSVQGQTGLYVPVHRRTSSTSSATSATSPASFHDRAYLLPDQRRSKSRSQSRSPALRTRSVSPLPAHVRPRHVSQAPMTPLTPLNPRTNANIPPASKIPGVYALTELLALASSPSTGLSPAQRAQVDAHILFMTRKSSSTTSAYPSSSPETNPKPLDGQNQTQNQGKKADAQQQRRRRSGRKAPNASLSLSLEDARAGGRRGQAAAQRVRRGLGVARCAARWQPERAGV